MLDRVDSLLVRYLPPLMQKTPDQWMRLGAQAKWNHFNSQVMVLLLPIFHSSSLFLGGINGCVLRSDARNTFGR
jgi:hypothetical protein